MVQVVERVGAILNAFSNGEPDLSLNVCAERSGLSKSSTHRLLVAMAEIGLVERAGNAKWRIGGFVVQLATARLAHADLHSDIAAEVRALGMRFGAATALSVPNGHEMVYVDRTESPLPFAPAAKLGSTAPMWAGASGHAILASIDHDAREAILSTPAFGQISAAMRAAVRKDVTETQVRGYAIDRGAFFEGVAGVAVAIGGRSEPVAAVSLLVSPDRLTPELTKEMGEALAELARRAISTNFLLSTG